MRQKLRSGRAARVTAIVALGVLLGATAACGSDDSKDGNVTIRFEWWGNQDRATVTEQAIDLFEKKYPNIKVETAYAEFNAYFQKLATQVGGGGGPDVFQMDYRYVREYGDRNVLARLESGSARVDTSGVTPQLLGGGTVEGKLYGIPVAQNTQALTYDPAAWQAAGATAPADGWKWSDLKTATDKISTSTNNKVKGIVDFGGIEDWFEVWLRQQGKSLYTDAGKLGYTAEDLTRYWQLATDFRKSGAATLPEVTTKIDGNVANDPVTQKTASSGFSYDSSFTAKTFEIAGRPLAFAPFPSDGADLGQYAKPSMLFSIAQRSSHKPEAAKLINFLINDPGAGKVLGMSRGLPSNQQVRNAVGSTLTGPQKVAFEYENAVASKLKPAPAPPPKGAGAVKTAFQRVYDDVMFGRATAEDTAKRLLTEANQAIQA